MVIGDCPLCSREASVEDSTDSQRFQCKACGSFQITGTALATLESIDDRTRIRVGFWTRDQNALGEIPTVDTRVFKSIEQKPEVPVVERLDRLLRYAIAEQGSLGGQFSPYDPSATSATHSQTTQDVLMLASALHEDGLLAESEHQGWMRVTPRGFIRAAASPRSSIQVGFIAMWFDPSMDAVRSDALEPAIRSAGYSPIIVSGVEHINKIDDEIISQIRRARFVVADFTGHRGGVYFEAGFAMGLGLPVFWTCRRDHLAALHFDIRQYNCIDWTDPADLHVRLRRRIEAVLGAGPLLADGS